MCHDPSAPLLPCISDISGKSLSRIAISTSLLSRSVLSFHLTFSPPKLHWGSSSLRITSPSGIPGKKQDIFRSSYKYKGDSRADFLTVEVDFRETVVER